MHVVDVHDPFFGNWLYLWPYGNGPTVWMGPMVSVPIRIEKIWQGKGIAKLGTLTEKAVQHVYVDGDISGNVSSYGNNITWPMSGGSYYKETGYPVTYYYWYDVTSTGTSAFSASFHVVYHREVRYLGTLYPSYTRDGTADFTVSKTVDQYNGQVTYSAPVVTGGTGVYTPPGFAVLVKTTPFTCGQDGQDPKLIASVLPSWIRQQYNELPGLGKRRHVRDEAIWQAIDDLEVVNINYLDDYQDLARPLAAVRRLSQGLRKSGLSAIRQLSNMHLFWRYCLKTNLLTFRETQDLIQFLTTGASSVSKRIANSTMLGYGEAQETVTRPDGIDTITYTAKVVYGGGFGGFTTLAEWRLLGLLPGAGDIWDLIPLSFVLDWVMPIQKTINKFEHLTDALLLPLKYILIGRKYERTLDRSYTMGNHTFGIDLTRTYYSRTVLKSLPLDMGLGQLNFRDPRKNLLTGIALGVSRR